MQREGWGNVSAQGSNVGAWTELMVVEVVRNSWVMHAFLMFEPIAKREDIKEDITDSTAFIQDGPSVPRTPILHSVSISTLGQGNLQVWQGPVPQVAPNTAGTSYMVTATYSSSP